MATQAIILLVINVIGGIAVIGSYAQGVLTHTDSGSALWGGMPQSVRPVYGVSMLLAALGYFAFIYYILFKLEPNETQIAGSAGYWLFYVIFLGILVPSALWMPLTLSAVANPGGNAWIWVRTVLILVGVSSCVLVWALLTINIKEPALPYWLAVAGSAYFAFHTAVLDMLIWPVLFK